MFVIWGPLVMGISLMGLAVYGWWHNRQVDKYNEWIKEHGNDQY